MTLHKAIKEHEEYLISDSGRVYSLKSKKYLKPRKRLNVYYEIHLGRDNETYLIHRLVADAFIPNPNNLETVHHVNHVRGDNRAINLRWLSNSENASDAIKQTITIYEIINDGLSLKYKDTNSVPNISGASISGHTKNREEYFTIKQRNGRTRHFKAVYPERSEL